MIYSTKGNNMFVKKNQKNRTWFVGQRNDNSGIYYSVPFNKSKKKSQLTIKIDGKRLDLNGRDICLLKKILFKGIEAKSWKPKTNKKKH